MRLKCICHGDIAKKKALSSPILDDENKFLESRYIAIIVAVPIIAAVRRDENSFIPKILVGNTVKYIETPGL